MPAESEPVQTFLTKFRGTDRQGFDNDFPNAHKNI